MPENTKHRITLIVTDSKFTRDAIEKMVAMLLEEGQAGFEASSSEVEHYAARLCIEVIRGHWESATS